jgi:hypothetical protein
MWAESERKLNYTVIDKLMGRRPLRYHVGGTKQECDAAFRELMTFALEQAEQVRRGKQPIDIYPSTASVVQIQSKNYGVER